MDVYTTKTINKVKRMYDDYKKFLYNTVTELSCENAVIPAPPEDPAERAKFSAAMPQDGWKVIKAGDTWGGDFRYDWFRAQYTVPQELDGKTLLIKPDIGLAEALLFINGKPSGLFDYNPEIKCNSARLHEVQPLVFDAKAGETFEIVLECYAGHELYGTHPEEDREHNDWNFYPYSSTRVFNSIDIVLCDEVVAEFLMQHRTVKQIIDCYEETSTQRMLAVQAFQKLFELLPRHPQEVNYDWHNALQEANAVLKSVTSRKSAESEELGYIGLIGHSHLDTAWQWPVRETLHKAARTFSNALRLMERYPDYHFIQSSVVYIDWMKKYYPDIYEGIKKRTAEGRWEPNGGAWVECDDNIPNGEFMIRQFLYGQRYTKENLDYMADSFWQPDTFGYSAAIPQILKGCGIKYFLTTKLSWNEANSFPHDSFIWKGLDGSEVLTHFNLTHNFPDVVEVHNSIKNTIKHPEISNMKLMSYGYGDGGGGPSYSMLESEKIIKDMVGMPKLESTTVSAFMNRLEKTAKNLPTYSGELYLELHRGTLTQMHNIKRSNRLLEKAIRNYELLSVLQGKENDQLLTDSIKILLTNQFHDILPGTCLADAHDVAIYENTKATEDLYNGMQAQFENSAEKTVFNPLSWDRDGQVLFDADFTPENCVAQKITNVYGETYTAVSGLKLPALSVSAVKSGTPKSAESPFKVDGDHISTPFADIVLEKGAIKSYKTKQGFEVVADATAPLNTFYFGEDIPIVWDNWDIDYDQPRKMKPIAECLSSEVVACGPLQLRVRVTYKIDDSTLSQDIVFYADTPRIDFESVVDWKTPHSLLKTGFKVNVLSNDARFEVQFGNVKRPTHENFGTDKTQFEVCNHKWTDLSDTRFGVAILNDCKYGISVDGNDMRLTLHKGGCRPDIRGDQGVHRFTYSLLVHESGFSTESVIRPAYELNYPAPVFDGTLAGAQNGSLLSVDAENVIVEAVKPSEDGNGYIVRLYEAEGSHANCTVKVNATAVAETNMLEMEDKPLTLNDGAAMLQFHPFEIKTLRIAK